MQASSVEISPQQIVKAEPLRPERFVSLMLGTFIWVGVLVFFSALISDYPSRLLWGSFFTNVLFWVGISVGGVMICPIVQIVRATWAAPVRRIAEAHVAFLPWAYALLMLTYFGRHELYPWANSPMPGREWWMQPGFVYVRFAILFALFFLFLYQFVRISLRSDIGYAREIAPDMAQWKGRLYASLTKGWQGIGIEAPILQRRMSILAPLAVVFYALVWTLFATEMIMSMDTVWYSNMFGGFEFLGNVYMGWAAIVVWVVFLAKQSPVLHSLVGRRQFWDLGMLMLGFCMLWGYTFFSQFLPQWYGNLPEETQWLILRSREFPWQPWGYAVLCCSFVVPFILLLSEDIKKNPKTLAVVAYIIFLGLWLERFVVVMPQLSPSYVPIGFVDLGIFIGMFGLYATSIIGFLKKYPIVAASHPQLQGETKSW